MPKRGKKKGKSSNFMTGVVSIPIRGTPFRFEQTSSGTGCIQTAESNVSLAYATTVELDPFAIGGRLNALASIYAQYRIKSGTLTYSPLSSYSGIISNAAGPVAGSYAERGLAWCIVSDPAIVITNYSQVGEVGKFFRTSQRASLKVPRSGWLFTSTTLISGSTTAIDRRLACFGRLSAVFREASTTATQAYGDIQMALVVEFRYPLPIAVTIGTPSTPSEEKSWNYITQNEDLATKPDLHQSVEPNTGRGGSSTEERKFPDAKRPSLVPLVIPRYGAKNK